MHSAVALVVSALVFPSSISAQFTDRLQASVSPLITGLELHRTLLQTPTDSPNFSTKGIIATVNQADGSLANLAAAARLLKIDIIYSRFGPSDFQELHKLMRRLVVRSNGMTVYFTLLDPTRERFPVTPAPLGSQTPVTTTPSTSRPPSPDHDNAGNLSRRMTPVSAVDEHRKSAATRRRRHPRLRYGKSDLQAHSHSHHRHPAHYGESRSQEHDNLLHNSLLHLAISRNPKPEHAVGVFESNRYLNLESMHLSHPDSVQTTVRITKLLDESADELIGDCTEALKGVHKWMGQVREGRWDFWVGKMEKTRDLDTKIKKYEEMKNKLEDTLQRFRYEKR
jgi:Putative ER transporter, 6TM, N-terminal